MALRFRILSLFMIVVVASVLGIVFISNKVSSSNVISKSELNSPRRLSSLTPTALTQISTALSYTDNQSMTSPPKASSSTNYIYVSSKSASNLTAPTVYNRLNTIEIDVNNVIEGTVLFLNSFDTIQTVSTKNMNDWNWNDLLAPRLASPGVSYESCLQEIKSRIQETKPQAIVFLLSALMLDDVPSFSQYMANQLRHFFELLHFITSFEKTRLFLVTPYSFETGIRRTWSRSFSLMLMSSHVSHLGRTRIIHMKKPGIESCSDNTGLVFKKLLSDHGNLQEEVVFCPNRKQSGGKNVIISTYFTTGKYSQYGHPFKANDFRFMKRWFQSGSKLGATLIIFHDDLRESFQAEIKNIYSKVEFVKITKFGPGRTPNDGRFFVWYDYLQANPDIDSVLATDIRDVHFLADPFEVMNIIGNYLYLGVDNSFHMNAFSNNGVRSNTQKCHAKDKNVDFYLKLRPFYNAGVVGGKRNTVMNFFRKMMEYLSHTPKEKNCNMGTYALVAGKFFFNSSFTGYPFQSAFKIGLPGPTNLAIKHKVFPGNNVYDESLD